MAPLPATRASIVIITQNTREKYANGNEKLTIYSTETLDVPAAKNGERRSISFAPVKMRFDAWRDDSNVGGEDTNITSSAYATPPPARSSISRRTPRKSKPTLRSIPTLARRFSP